MDEVTGGLPLILTFLVFRTISIIGRIIRIVLLAGSTSVEGCQRWKWIS